MPSALLPEPQWGIVEFVTRATSRRTVTITAASASQDDTAFRLELSQKFLANWEAGHGALTAEEIARAERELGLAAGDTAA